jgi:hypothetical protein
MYFAIQSSENLMRELNRALGDIVEIRAQIAAGTAFRGYGPTTVAVTGIMGFATATLQSLWPNIFAYNVQAFVISWIVTGGICAVAVCIEMRGRSRRLHSYLANTMIKQALEQFLPAAAASLFVPLFFLRFSPQSIWMMPGLWQLFVSLGIFASIRTLPRRIGLGGIWYFLSGFVSLLLANTSHVLSPWLMGIPFFAGQLLMATILFFSVERANEEE